MQHGGLPLFDTRFAREVRRLVAGLGTSRRSVAAALEATGVRAAPGDAACSPVGIYLGAVIGADPNVKSVKTDGRTVVVELRAWWRPDVTVSLPAAVREFAAAFDARFYPGLVRTDRAEHADRADAGRAERTDRGDADGVHRVPGPARSAPRSSGRQTSGQG